ncbi:MAG TPA: AI-2E family transporter [Acidimicrobiales bacterium]|nr:AI-2E family transporter [Acidimicrobiales bacterium]
MTADKAAMAERRRRLVVDVEPTTLAALAAAFLGLVAVVGLVGSAPRTATALAIAAVLAIALDPVVTRLAQRLRTRRGFAVAILALAVAIAASLAAALIAPPTYRQADRLSSDLPDVVQSMTRLPIVGGRLADAGVPEKARAWIERLPDRLAGDTTPLRDAAGTAFNGFTALVLVLLFTAALLIDGPFLVDHTRRALPARSRAAVARASTAARDVVGRYVAGSLTVAGIAGLFTLVTGLILRVPLAPLLAVWVSMWDLVPQIGGAAGGVPFVLLAFTVSPLTGVICAVLFVLYLQLENNVVQPLLVGRAVQLSPPATMAAALIGVSAGGVVGALLAVPLTGAAKAIYLERRGKTPESA